MASILASIGVPVGKLLGGLLNPIRSLSRIQDKLLKQSPRVINIAEQEAPGQATSVLSKVREQTVPQLEQKGFGSETLDALNKLRANVASAVTAFKPPPVVGDIAPLSLPHFLANQLKRSFGQGTRDAYGKLGTAEEELRKGFIRTLGQEVTQGRPDIGFLNKAMSTLYFPQNMGQGLTRAMGLFGGPSYYAGRALQGGAGLISGGIGKLGDVSKYLLPGLFQNFQSNE